MTTHKVCPKCKNEEFEVTYHITQSVLVDGKSRFIRAVTDCDEVTHAADDDDIWNCSKCGYSAAGTISNVPD